MSKIAGFCCEDMECNVKELKSVNYNEVFDEYSINLLEDNYSCILMEYCPWCGSKLPESKRIQWFEELEKLGFEEPLFNENIPEEYKSRKWREK